MGTILGGLGFPPGGEPGGPRRGRWFGDRGRLAGRRGTNLLVAFLVVLVLAFVITLF